MKPVKELIQLAEFRLQNASEEEYIVRKNAYIDHYGDRTVEELKMESRTFRTNPELLDQKIEEYASDSLKLQEICDLANELDEFLAKNFLYNAKLPPTQIGRASCRERV